MRGILAAILIFQGVAHAEDDSIKCEWALAATPVMARESFSNFVKLPSGSEIFVRIQSPRFFEPKGWFYMVHGLLDSHRAYDAVTQRLLASGYGVVRMDLNGFARSLHRQATLAAERGRPYVSPLYLDYQDQVRDLRELLIHLREIHKIHKPHVVGHSMGGGLAIALLADPAAQGLVDGRATVVAPYIYRLEYFLLEKVLFNTIPVGNSLSHFNAYLPPFLKIGHEFIADTMIGNATMSGAFGEYFDRMAAESLRDVTPKDLEVIRRRHIDTAIAAVKGLRELNSIHAAREIPAGIVVDMIHGRHDQVVEEPLAQRLGRALERRGGRIFTLDAGHLTLSETPDLVTKILIHRSIE